MKIKKAKKTSLDFFNLLVLIFIIFLPTQLGKHFFFNFSYLSGVRIDYLAYVFYFTDIIVLTIMYLKRNVLFEFFKRKIVAFIFFLLALSIFFSFSPQVALFRFWKILEVTSLFVIFRKTSIKGVFIYWGLFVSCCLELITVSLQFINQHSIQGFFYFLGERYFSSSMSGIAKIAINGEEYLRPYGTFSHPNSMAGFFLLVYSFILGSNLNKNHVLKNLIIFISSLLIFISFSKTAIFGYILINIIFLFKEIKKSQCKLCVVSRTIVFSLAGLFFIFGQNDPLSLFKRIILFENSLNIISKYPITGVGLGNYLIAQNLLENKIFSYPPQPVHNVFMLALCEIGIFLWSAIVYLFYKVFYKHIKSTLFLLCFFAFFITGFFDHYWLTLQQNLLQLGFVFGLILNRRVVF